MSWELNKIYKIQSLKTYQKKTDASTTNCNTEQRVFRGKKSKVHGKESNFRAEGGHENGQYYLITY